MDRINFNIVIKYGEHIYPIRHKMECLARLGSSHNIPAECKISKRSRSVHGGEGIRGRRTFYDLEG